MRRRKACFVLFSFIVLLVCSGCWDRREINDTAIVIAIAIDKEKDGLYRFSVQVPLVGQLGGPGGGGGGTGGVKSYYIDSEVGQTIREAGVRLQRRMARELFYAHQRVVIVGEELAREGISPIFDILARFPENRLTAYMVVAKGEGRALLEAQPKFERYSGEAMREIVKTFALPINIKEIAYMLTEPNTDPIIPMMRVVETKSSEKSKEVQVTGYAQFRRDKMVALFPPKASNGLNWFSTRFIPYNTVLDLGKQGKVNIAFETGNVNITPILQGDRLRFRIKVNSQASIQENTSNINFDIESNVKELERKLNQHIKNTIESTLNQMKKRSTDNIGLGLKVFRYYPDQWKEKYKEDWRSHLKNVGFTYDIHAQVINIGQTYTNITRGRRDE
ncbi:Ger(x)C family spore germination protein [Aneurinibacillus danicus]|uniref:Putative spore germination protein YfkR n=1 Tax=Aneurinibacillus danicus TaxID=267746 RepID=A0A511V546_9BACL|nr:Ger(x)C family spore germination protein [Aneurinibacillus danicus]GEN34065.1 putative spore germination protein YfkR [Aneurinibacillus danicus]